MSTILLLNCEQRGFIFHLVLADDCDCFKDNFMLFHTMPESSIKDFEIFKPSIEWFVTSQCSALEFFYVLAIVRIRCANKKIFTTISIVTDSPFPSRDFFQQASFTKYSDVWACTCFCRTVNPHKRIVTDWQRKLIIISCRVKLVRIILRITGISAATMCSIHGEEKDWNSSCRVFRSPFFRPNNLPVVSQQIEWGMCEQKGKSKYTPELNNL